MPRDLLKLRNRPSLLVVILTIMVSATWTTASRAEPVSATSDIAIDHGAAVTNTENDEKGLPQKAVEIGRVFGFPITNSMLVSWIAALGLIVFAQCRVAPRISWSGWSRASTAFSKESLARTW